MYVIDAISRNAHAIWRKKEESDEGVVGKQILERFETMFTGIDLAEIFRKCTEKDKVGSIETTYRCQLGGRVDRVADDPSCHEKQVDIRVNLSAHINHSLSKSSSNTDFF